MLASRVCLWHASFCLTACFVNTMLSAVHACHRMSACNGVLMLGSLSPIHWLQLQHQHANAVLPPRTSEVWIVFAWHCELNASRCMQFRASSMCCTACGADGISETCISAACATAVATAWLQHRKHHAQKAVMPPAGYASHQHKCTP